MPIRAPSSAILVLAALCLAQVPALGLNLVPNPSAEEGASAPGAWTCLPATAAAWPQGGARFGARSLALKARPAGAAWEAALPEHHAAAQGYRLSGWIRTEHGRGWLELKLRLPGGRQTLRRTPAVACSAWTYVATDLPQPRGGEMLPVAVRAVAVAGSVRFDGLRLTPLDINILPNPTLSPLLVDDKPLPGEPPAGWHALPATGNLQTTLTSGDRRVLCLGEGSARAAASYLVNLPAGTRACRLQAEVESDGELEWGLSWFGPHGRLRDDLIPAPAGKAELLHLWPAPPGANRVQAVWRLRSGRRALLFPQALIPVLRPDPPAVAVFANQVGYEPGSRMTATVASSFFPGRVEEARFEVVEGRGKVVAAGRLQSLGRMHEGRPDDWGRYYWLADFTGLPPSDRYRVVATVGGKTATSHPFRVGRGVVFAGIAELTYRHFYYQRCGVEVPGWHGACHLDDGRLPDGTHIPVSGGWHDAGDYNKWMHAVGPALALYGLSSAYLAHPAWFDRLDRDGNGQADLRDEIAWGADFLLRMRNPRTGGLYGSVTTGWGYWGKAEKETDNIPGNADDRPVLDEDQSASRAAAALALAARCLPNREACLQAAIGLEQHSRKEGASPDRLLACLAIWQAGGSSEYLAQAREIGRALAAGAPQGLALAALALLMQADPESGNNPVYRRTLAASVTALARLQAQPFPLAAGRAGHDTGMDQADRLGQWGHHMDLTSHVWAMAACARVLDSPLARQAAANELNWLLGQNPLDLCMIHGAGSHHPARYHHRYASYPGHRDGAVPGAIPNGIARPPATPGLDLPFMDEINRNPTSDEPWIPYNGFLLCALAQMEAGE